MSRFHRRALPIYSHLTGKDHRGVIRRATVGEVEIGPIAPRQPPGRVGVTLDEFGVNGSHRQHECLNAVQPGTIPPSFLIRPFYRLSASELPAASLGRGVEASGQHAAIQLERALRERRIVYRSSVDWGCQPYAFPYFFAHPRKDHPRQRSDRWRMSKKRGGPLGRTAPQFGEPIVGGTTGCRRPPQGGRGRDTAAAYRQALLRGCVAFVVKCVRRGA